MSTLPEPGCYVDSHWGQYATARAVQIALDLGWKDADASGLADRHLASMGPARSSASGRGCVRELTGDEFERLMGAVDEAEDWLNEHAAPEGFAWGWNDGDFGLYALEDDDEAA